jgi:NAD(P)-dependent dehydrogenase (short-subunit alcohol dehydrogenase family)
MLNITDKVAIVTGASEGLGFATALGLARRGAHVIAIARNITKLENLDDCAAGCRNPVTLAPLDLQDFQGVFRLAKMIYDRWGRLDIMINCAASPFPMTPIASIEPNSVFQCFSINTHIVWILLQAMDSLIRSNENGSRVLFATDMTNRGKFLGIHAGARAAARECIRAYALEIAYTQVCKVGTFEPSPMPTGLRHCTHPREDTRILETAFSMSEALIANLIDDTWQTAGHISLGADMQVSSNVVLEKGNRSEKYYD